MSAREIREKVVYVAQSNIYGEQGANNDGEFIRAMGGVPGEEWCALYGGYCYRRAYQLLGLPPPRWAWRRYPGRLEVGAKALVRALGESDGGVEFTDPTLIRPGDLGAFHRRTGLITWRGHLVVWTYSKARPKSGVRALLRTLEGNVGEFPAVVQPFEYEAWDNGTWWRTGRSGKTVPVRYAYSAGLRH